MLLAHVEHVVKMHNLLRGVLQKPDGRSHFVNEDTLVRLAAAVEAAGGEAPKGRATGSEEWGEICARTLFLFRNIVMHDAAGRFEPTKLEGSVRHLPAYEAFCAKHPDARVGVGERLCLAADSVMRPLLEGCLAYYRSPHP